MPVNGCLRTTDLGQCCATLWIHFGQSFNSHCSTWVIMTEWRNDGIRMMECFAYGELQRYCVKDSSNGILSPRTKCLESPGLAGRASDSLCQRWKPTIKWCYGWFCANVSLHPIPLPLMLGSPWDTYYGEPIDGGGRETSINCQARSHI